MTLRWVPGWNGLTEPEAVSYVAAVEAADGQELEFGVAKAINDFVLGCKQDGIWDAIKASCILAGARTLAGALVPLVGTAPTSYNFMAGDYNRETGLVGDGSTKYLDSNRSNNADPQNDQHLSTYITQSSEGAIIGAGLSDAGTSAIYHSPGSNNVIFRSRSGSSDSAADIGDSGLIAYSRSSSSDYDYVAFAATGSFTRASQTPYNVNIYIFGRNAGAASLTAARLAFYSIGESLDLAALDTRVSALITAIGAAIP
jgi:hypothetical protein